MSANQSSQPFVRTIDRLVGSCFPIFRLIDRLKERLAESIVLTNEINHVRTRTHGEVSANHKLQTVRSNDRSFQPIVCRKRCTWAFAFRFYFRGVCHMKTRLLDLYSGTHSVGNVAQELGYNVTSLDLQGADIECNVLEWNYTDYEPGYFDIIWASPPCETFSTVRRSNIGRNGYTHESIEKDMLERGVPILRKTEQIIKYFEPKLWFMENPQTGKMKDFVDPSINFYDVD